MVILILCGLAKAIARHSLTGLNIIIFHDGLFNIWYCHYNQKGNYKIITLKLHFENLSILFLKSALTLMRGPHLPLFVFVRFSITPPPPPLLNERTFWMTPYENLGPRFSSISNYFPQLINRFGLQRNTKIVTCGISRSLVIKRK